jgi:hypothetical protein
LDTQKLSADHVGLREGTRELNTRHGTDLDDRVLWRAVVRGRIPAVRFRGRWYIARQDYPLIIRTLSAPAPTVRNAPAAAAHGR